MSLSLLIDLACLHQRKKALVSMCTILTVQFFCNIEAKGQTIPFEHCFQELTTGRRSSQSIGSLAIVVKA